MIRKNLVFIIVISLIINACSSEQRTNIDVTDIDVQVNIKRLDKDIFEIDLGDVEKSSGDLIEKYDAFFDLYNSLIVKLGNPCNENYSDLLIGFVTDYTMNKVYAKTLEKYPDLSLIEDDLEDAFKRFKYYFPEITIPTFYSYIGGFNQSIVVADSILAIGLDKYLGADCVFYDRLGTPEYLQQNMTSKMISIDAMKAWILTEFVYNDSIDNVVNNMVYHGKIQYALRILFPTKADSLLFGFNGEELRWCIKNENQMWNYLIDQKLLFSTDYMLINQLINPAPFTSGFPNESPGRACVWLGEKIVSAYMKKNSNISLKDLMLDTNYQKILSESRYEP
jgi:hypothetical protein